MAERYADGSRVEGEVIEVRLLGVKVRLDDGQIGFIRRRESVVGSGRPPSRAGGCNRPTHLGCRHGAR